MKSIMGYINEFGFLRSVKGLSGGLRPVGNSAPKPNTNTPNVKQQLNNLGRNIRNATKNITTKPNTQDQFQTGR